MKLDGGSYLAAIVGLALVVVIGCAGDSERAVDSSDVNEEQESETVQENESSDVEEESSEEQESDTEQPVDEGGAEEEETVDLSCEPVGGDSPTWYGDIERIFFENCQVCHADTPLYGAPMSLSSYGDVEGPSFSSESVSMIEMIGARVADGTMPPSSQMPMPEGDLSLIHI